MWAATQSFETRRSGCELFGVERPLIGWRAQTKCRVFEYLVQETETDMAKTNPKPIQPKARSGMAIKPEVRPLKAYAFDPSLGRYIGNEMTLQVKYEKLLPGPIGRRIAVIDYDGANKVFYQPVDLDDPSLLICGGLGPSES